MTVIRAMLPGEARIYAEHLLRLPAEDRRARFMTRTEDDRIHDHVARIDWSRAYILGVFVRGQVRAAAELRWLPDRKGEVALSVEPGFQGQGLGGTLLRRAVIAARNRGLRSLGMTCLPDNRRMQSLTRKQIGPYITEGGEVRAEVALPAATPLSLTLEILERVRVPLNSLLDGWRPPVPPDLTAGPDERVA